MIRFLVCAGAVTWALLATTAHAQAGPTKPAPVAQKPAELSEEIGIYRETSSEHKEPDNPALIRPAGHKSNAYEWIPMTEFPKALLPSGETETNVHLRLTIAPDDAISACVPLAVSDYDRKIKKRVAGDPRLGPLACGLLQKYGQFRHAIDGAGNPASSEVVRVISFSRRRDRMSAVPFPPRLPGWIGPGGYDSTYWPPSYATVREALSEPDWKSFLPKSKDRRAFGVGVTMQIAGDGTPAQCEIGRSGGDAARDAAICAAMMSVRYRPTGLSFRSTSLFLVRGAGRKAQLAAPGGAVMPLMAAPVALTEADRPGAALPRYTAVRLKVWLDAAGLANRCQIQSSSFDDRWDAASCAIAMRGRYLPGRDIFGDPSIGGMNLRLDWAQLKLIEDRGY